MRQGPLPVMWVDLDDLEQDDLGFCPYNLRGLPGCDPKGICYQLGVCEPAGEPWCMTEYPREGWLSLVLWLNVLSFLTGIEIRES